MAWYRDWFGRDYLDLYSYRDDSEAERHIDFVEGVLGDGKPSRVLDLACGAGRHTTVLRDRGYQAVGLDLSLTLLTQKPVFPRVAGDIRTLPFADDGFDRVLNFFTSFGYFPDERQNFRVLEEIARVLAPGGRFLIDLFNRERVLEGLVPSETRLVGDGTVEIERWFDARTERVNKRIRFLPERGDERTFVESVRAYTADEVAIGLKWAGLRLDAMLGDFDRSDYGPDSERMILIGSRPTTSGEGLS